MATEVDLFTLGVEEEFLIIDPDNRRLAPQAERILPRAKEAIGEQVALELQSFQIEIGTTICRTLDDVRRELIRLRREVAAAAGQTGKVIGAAGTHPIADWRASNITPKEAYQSLERDYQQLAREQMICGCHIHVGLKDREEALKVMNRVHPWLSPILALSVNSPFWWGVDTGYGSFRSEIWRRWPMAGTAHYFSSLAEYDDLVETLIATKSIDEPARIYWDVRPSANFRTIEFRVTDVCLSIDEAVMIAALVRSLVRTCHRMLQRGEEGDRPRPELIKAASWRAARYGIDGDLIDLQAGRAVPAKDLVAKFLRFLEPDLTDHGEKDIVGDLVAGTFADGTGATRQREAFRRRGRLEDVVDYIVEKTAP